MRIHGMVLLDALHEPPRLNAMTSELMKTLEGIRDGVAGYRKDMDGLAERIEQLEAKNDRPHHEGRADGAEYKVLITASGPAFEVPSHVSLASIPELGPTKQPEISLERWLAATVAGERCGDKQAVEFAREQKQLVTTSTGVLIPAEYQTRWIDLLRARSVLNAAGMRTTTMTAKTQQHSAVTGDPAVTWHTEAGSISAANPTFAARTLTAQTIVARCQASVELAQDSPDFGAQLASVMTGAIAAEIDRVGLEGSGTPPQPRGIKNTSGRSSQTATGALTDFEEIISGIGALLGANCDLEQVSRFAIMSPGSWTAYENLVTGISSDKTQLPRPRSVQDMKFLVTSNIAGNIASSPQVLTTIYLGDFRDLLLGVRLESSIEVLKLTTFASNLLLEFVGYARADFLVTRPASFHTVEGVLA
jgi:HK97 family phage major capsid protein